MNQLSGEHFAAINNINERRHAFVDYIGKFYNSGNRAIKLCTCTYSKTETSPGCAIGQFLPCELAETLDSLGGSSICAISMDSNLYPQLPNWMREMGVDFLSSCQILHDGSTHWCETGLTHLGELELTHIKKRITNGDYDQP
jgi:hypothetical protein